MLMKVHLTAIFYTEDLKSHDFNEILKSVIDDLNILETNMASIY